RRGGRPLAKVAGIGGVVNDDAAFGCRCARCEQLIDWAVDRDGEVGAATGPALDALRDRAGDGAGDATEFGTSELGKNLVHVENESRAATARGESSPEQKVGQGVHVNDLHLAECTMRGDQFAATQDEVAVLDEIGKEAATRLAPWNANHDDAVDRLRRALACLANRDDRATP